MALLSQTFYFQRRQQIIDQFYQQVQQTERFRFKQINAAVKIQALFRMYRQRKKYKMELWAVRIIKRVYQGYRTRKTYWKLVQEALRLQQRRFYDAAATSIQRVYKGYYSRQYFHDYWARKKYLQHIEAKNARRLQKMEVYRNTIEIEDQKRQEDYARMEFYKLASSLHHLTSTKAIAGVYANLEQVSDFGKHSLKTQ